MPLMVAIATFGLAMLGCGASEDARDALALVGAFFLAVLIGTTVEGLAR